MPSIDKCGLFVFLTRAGEEIKDANETKPSDNMGAAYRASLGGAANSNDDTFQVKHTALWNLCTIYYT